MDTVSIYTDGSCNRIDKTGGWAFIGLLGTIFHEQAAFVGGTTTNRMELMGILKAVEWLDDEESPVRIFTDSEYSINAIGACHRYKQNGWKTFEGDEVANIDLLRAIIARLDHHRENRAVSISHVKGHNNNGYNEKADYLAGSARTLRLRHYKQTGQMGTKMIPVPDGWFEVDNATLEVIAASENFHKYLHRYTHNIFRKKQWHHLINPPLMKSAKIKLAAIITPRKKSPLGTFNCR